MSFPEYNKFNRPTYHLVIINFKFENLNLKEKFISHLLKKKIIVQYHYKPINHFTVYNKKNIGSGQVVLGRVVGLGLVGLDWVGLDGL